LFSGPFSVSAAGASLYLNPEHGLQAPHRPQLPTILQASAIRSGFFVTRELVEMRTKAGIVCQGKATVSSELKAASNQERQTRW
jgi:hypothetical protein